MRSRYVVASGVLFGIMAAVQTLRALNQWPVLVADQAMPVWASWVAVAITGSFCAWAFRSRQK